MFLQKQFNILELQPHFFIRFSYSQSRKLIYLVSIGVFSFAPLIGVAIGIILTEVAYEDSVNQTAVQCIQAIATGTIIYVVFFEIFPKGKEIGGTGFQHVVAMTAGFLAFLPTLLLRKYHHLLPDKIRSR